MRAIIFATGNANKMVEVREILKDLQTEVFSLKDAGITVDVEENGATFEENALIKVDGIAAWCGENGIPAMPDRDPSEFIILADDSGLEIDKLNKEPGVYSARYMGYDTSYREKNANPTNNRISQFIGTFKRFCNRAYGRNIWQARSYDHVIRGEQDYREIWAYIDENPSRWTADRFFIAEGSSNAPPETM